MWYTLAWDWRRDLYEQSQFVAARVRALRAATGCRPIVAGHSYGGRLIYTAVARFADLSDEIAGMMYFTAPLVGTTALTPSACPARPVRAAAACVQLCCLYSAVTQRGAAPGAVLCEVWCACANVAVNGCRRAEQL